jgi:hypothetical protein
MSIVLEMFWENIKLSMGTIWRDTLIRKNNIKVTYTSISYEWRIYASLVLDGKTFMVKTLKDKHSFIRPATIKVVSSTLIAKS